MFLLKFQMLIVYCWYIKKKNRLLHIDLLSCYTHLLVPGDCFVDSLMFSTQKIISFANNNSFISSFSICARPPDPRPMHSQNLQYVVKQARLEGVYLVYFLSEGESIQSVTIKYDVSYKFFVDVLYQVQEAFIYFQFVESFIINLLDFVQYFFCVSWHDHVIFLL